MNWAETLKMLQAGDFFGVEGKGPAKWAQYNLIRPRTRLIHFGLLGDYIPFETDFVILESLGSIIYPGVKVGRLSWYKNKNFDVFRINHPSSLRLGKKAARQATRYGRARYDFRIIPYIVWHASRAIISNAMSGKGFYADYSDIPAKVDISLLCTEIPEEAYRGVYPVTDSRALATPPNYRKSELDKAIVRVASWRKGS